MATNDHIAAIKEQGGLTGGNPYEALLQLDIPPIFFQCCEEALDRILKSQSEIITVNEE